MDEARPHIARLHVQDLWCPLLSMDGQDLQDPLKKERKAMPPTRCIIILAFLFMIPALSAKAEAAEWNTSLALGANLTEGNSETLALNASLTTDMSDKKNEWRLGAEGNYAEARQEQTQPQEL